VNKSPFRREKIEREVTVCLTRTETFRKQSDEIECLQLKGVFSKERKGLVMGVCDKKRDIEKERDNRCSEWKEALGRFEKTLAQAIGLGSKECVKTLWWYNKTRKKHSCESSEVDIDICPSI